MAEVAKLAYEHGHLVLCTFISSFRTDQRFAARYRPEATEWIIETALASSEDVAEAILTELVRQGRLQRR